MYAFIGMTEDVVFVFFKFISEADLFNFFFYFLRGRTLQLILTHKIHLLSIRAFFIVILNVGKLLALKHLRGNFVCAQII